MNTKGARRRRGVRWRGKGSYKSVVSTCEDEGGFNLQERTAAIHSPHNAAHALCGGGKIQPDIHLHGRRMRLLPLTRLGVLRTRLTLTDSAHLTPRSFNYALASRTLRINHTRKATLWGRLSSLLNSE